MTNLEWFESHSGETAEQLLSLEGKYRTDSLVVAFEQAIGQKAVREGEDKLSNEERAVLAIEALEREVNNGGYSQFFLNAPEFAAIIVDSLVAIDCLKTAEITRRATRALELSNLGASEVSTVMAGENEGIEEKLNECDAAYYDAGEDIAGQVLTFIKDRRSQFRL